MKRYSLRWRLVGMVLLIECALAAGITGATLIFTWKEQIHAFDLMLRGRADSLLGAVQDAEDPADNVRIDPRAIDLPHGDVWQVKDDPTGRVLGQSPNWSPVAAGELETSHEARSFHLRRHAFRGMVLHGVRQIDADDGSPGVARPVEIVYAASLHAVGGAMERTTRFLVLADVVLLLLTAVALMWLLRRGLAPLEELSRAAAELSPANLRFQAPEAAAGVAELAVLATALEISTQRLEQAFRQQQVFVHDAAHELKTAVTIVKTSLQLLASRVRNPLEYAEGLETCLNDCARMEELVQRMLLLARFEQRPAERELCDVSEVVRETGVQFENLAELRRIELRVEAEEEAWIPLSQEACSSLVSGLALNSLQHTPAGGRVKIAVRRGANEVFLTVRDTGTGIAAEDLPHVFDRFYRGDASRARTSGGTGLGLSICKAIVDSCGGRIGLSSASGAGTTAEVILPEARPAADAGVESGTSAKLKAGLLR